MKKRTLAIVMSLTLAAGMLAGCGDGKKENSENNLKITEKRLTNQK